MDVPHGPRRIGPKNQISLPSDLLAEIDVEQGQDLWVALNAELPGTLLLISAPVMAKMFTAGLSVVIETRAAGPPVRTTSSKRSSPNGAS